MLWGFILYLLSSKVPVLKCSSWVYGLSCVPALNLNTALWHMKVAHPSVELFIIKKTLFWGCVVSTECWQYVSEDLRRRQPNMSVMWIQTGCWEAAAAVLKEDRGGVSLSLSDSAGHGLILIHCFTLSLHTAISQSTSQSIKSLC